MTYRYEKRLPGVGTVRVSTKLSDPHDIEVFNGLMIDLARRKPRIVELFRDKRIDATAILRAHESENLSSLIPDERTILPLWASFEHAWSVSDAGPATLTRYRTSVRKLQRLSGLSETATVGDLGSLDWKALSGRWGGSNSDWMALYRMLSAFLTLHFGGGRVGKAHPFRLATMDALSRKAERPRVPNLTPVMFWDVVERVPHFVQPVYVALLGTGFRVRTEMLQLDRPHLRPEMFAVAVPGTKTVASDAVVPVDPRLWPWIDRAVPVPVKYDWLHHTWVRAAREAGLSGPGRYDGPRLHDLRHCTGQWAMNGGADEAAVQVYLRHVNPSTTRRYTMQQQRAEVSTIVTDRLFTGRAA